MVGTSAVSLAWSPPGGSFGYYYQPTLARVGIVVTAAVAIVAAIAVTRQVRRRTATPWLWATALLGLPAGWLGPFDSGGLRLAAVDPVPHFGRLAQLVLASCLGMVTIAWLARGRATTEPGPPSSTPARVAALALGAATGLGLFLALIGLTRAPAHVVAGLAVLSVVGLLGRPRSARPLLAGVAGTLVLAWLVGVYDNSWSVRGWTNPAHTAGLVITLALIPLSASAFVAAQTLLRARPRGERRPAAVLTLALSLGWIGYAALPYVLSWGPVLFVLVICCVAVAGDPAHR
jgi:hypothetical protein